MKAIILLFQGADSILDKTVRFLTNTNFRHAAIMFPEKTGNLLFEASGWKKQVLAYRQFKQIKPNTKFLEIHLTLDDDAPFKKAYELIGKPYDFKGFFLWNINRQKKGKLYCFEYLANILAQDSELKNYVSLVKDGSVSGQDIYNLAVDVKRGTVIKHDV